MGACVAGLVPLTDALAKGQAFSATEKVAIVLGAASAVAHVHAAGYVVGDLCNDTVYVGSGGVVKVLCLRAQRAGDVSSAPCLPSVSLTQMAFGEGASPTVKRGGIFSP